MLVGEPWLLAKLQGEEYEALRDRVLVDCELGAFTPDETREAILRRLAYNHDAPYTPEMDLFPFRDGAIEGIHRVTRGHPRKVMQLCADLINRCIEYQQEAIDGALFDAYFILEPQPARQEAR